MITRFHWFFAGMAADPEKRIPGQCIHVTMASAAGRGDLVAYLRSVSK
jgi:hypothetical protein